MKYLGIKIDESVIWNEHINYTAIKLSRANAMLYKVREFVNTMILKPCYFRLSFTLCKYSLGSKQKSDWLFLLLEKSLRIIVFECRNAHLL